MSGNCKVNSDVNCNITIPDRMQLLCWLYRNMALRSGPCVFTNLSVCSPVCLTQCGLSGLHVCLCLPVCVAHVCWCVVGTCRSFLPSGLCGGPLFGAIKVLLGFPVARISCDPAPCPAEVNVRFLLHPLLNLELTR